MPDRVDVLGPDLDRLLAFKGDLLDSALDTELEAIVADAATRWRAPISLVRLEFHRARAGSQKSMSHAGSYVVRNLRPSEWPSTKL